MQDNTVGTSATPKPSNTTRDRLLKSAMNVDEKDESAGGDRSWLETSLNASYSSAANVSSREVERSLKSMILFISKCVN